MSPRSALVSRSLALALVAGIAAAVASCGGSGGGGAGGGGGGGGGGSSTPPPAVDAGSPAGGGSPDAGQPTAGGGGAPDGGAPDGGPVAGGSGSGGGGGGGGGAGGGGGGSGSPDAGKPPSPCDGLAPDLSAPAREVLRDLGTHSHCGPATTDPRGQVALAQVGAAGADSASVHFYQSEGAAAGDLTGTLRATSSEDIDPWFHWTSDGYRGLAENNQGPGVPRIVVETFDRAGRPTAVGNDFGLAAVPDGHGGSALLELTAADRSGRPGPVKLSRMGDRGQYGASTLLDDSSASMLLVNWGTGHVLVLATGSAETRGRWFDESCRPLTAWFPVAGNIDSRAAALRLLVDGTMALSDGTRWVATFRDADARTSPPPPWLTSRPGTRLATIRGGRGYALLPDGRGESFDVVAADGTACGSASVPKSTPAAGTARQPTRLDVGQDGTLLQMENATGDRLGFGIHCALRWWPAAVR